MNQWFGFRLSMAWLLRWFSAVEMNYDPRNPLRPTRNRWRNTGRYCPWHGVYHRDFDLLFTSLWSVLMNDKQLGVLYTIMLTIWLVVILSLSYLLKEPSSIDNYADKLCQELYGPQTGHTWVDTSLMCKTARGEVLAVKAPQ
jgi:hypothetical protein